MAFPYDPTAPYSLARDITSERILPFAEEQLIPAALAVPKLGLRAARATAQHLREPLRRGGAMISRGLEGAPHVGPLGVAQDVSGLMASIPQKRAPEDYRYSDVTGSFPAGPTVTGARAPVQRERQAPEDYRYDELFPQSAAAGATSRSLRRAPAAPVAPGAPAAAPSPASAPTDGTDDELRERQAALEDYYTGVVGTGAQQRTGERAFGLSNALRGGVRGTGVGAGLAQGLEGALRGYMINKGLKSDTGREVELERIRKLYEERIGKARNPLIKEMVPGQFSTEEPRYG